MVTNLVSQRTREYIRSFKRKRIWKRATFVLSMATLVCTTFVLMRPAITMGNNQPAEIAAAAEASVSEEVAVNQANQIVNLSAHVKGTYKGITWELSPAVDGGYRLDLNTDTPVAVPSDLFGSSSGLSPYKNSISAVSLGKDITAVEANTFSDSQQLRTVAFAAGSQLTEIGAGAFSGCAELSRVNLEACTGLTALGEDAFSGTNLAQVTIPGSVVSVGNFAFCNCPNLNTVDIQPNTVLETMGAFVFAKCPSLETINLENLQGGNLTFGTVASFEGIADANGLFYECSALKSLTLPNMSGSIAGLCRGCSALTSLDLRNCSKLQCSDSTGNANFKDFILGCMELHELDLSGVTGMTALFPSMVGGGVKKVTLPPTLKKINSRFISNTGVEQVIFTRDENGKSQLARVEGQAFRYARHLKEIDLRFADTAAPFLGPWAFGDCDSLEKITISSPAALALGDNCFTSCGSLRELTWNVQSASINLSNPLVNDATGKNIHFSVGENVEKLPSDMIEKLKDNISQYSFAPEHSFYVDKGVAGTPFARKGCYYADATGSLYWLDGSTNPPSAELVYANHSGIGEFVIPSAFTSGVKYYGPDGNPDPSKATFVIRKVCSNAFKGTAYSSVTFEAPGNITAVADRAFAGAYNLERINGKRTEQEVAALLPNAGFGNDVYAETSITSNPFSGIDSGAAVQSVTKTDGGTFLYPSLSIDETENLVQISVESMSALEELKDKCVLATGETANLKIGISNNGSGKNTRVYIKLSDGDSGTATLPGDEVLPSLGNGIYYYDAPLVTGQTVYKNVNITYPNGASPNKKAYVWLVETQDNAVTFGNDQIIYPQEAVPGFTADNEYLEVTWDVLPETYSVEKIANKITPVIQTEGSVHAVENLSFQVSNGMTGREENIGADYVNYVRFEDVLTLPAGISWRSELFRAELKARINEDKRGGIITAELNNTTYTLCTLNLNTEILRDIRCEVVDGNNFKIIWSTENQQKDSQITDAETTITYGSDVILAESPEENYTIENTVNATPHYIYNGQKETVSAAASRNVTKGYPNLQLHKEWVKQPVFMGEEAVYRINVDNKSLIKYVGKVDIKDDLGDHQYLSPEVIQEMFANPDYDGAYLTIEIRKAVLLPTAGVVQAVTAVDGKTHTETALNNTAIHDLYSGLAKEYLPAGIQTNAVITLKKDGSGIRISSTGNPDILVSESGEYKTVQAALDHLGYLVTAKDQYIAHWELPDTTVLVANGHKEYIIHATAKNSLQALEGDQSFSIASTSVDFKYLVRNSLENWNAVHCYADCDLSISKTAVVGDTVIDRTNESVLADKIRKGNTVIGYKVNINHRGTGKYGLLPVADRMSGVQAILALKSDNVNPEWAEYCAEYTDPNGKEYYVLNQAHTYRGVYLGNAYADSITVTKAESGLDTLIKWYYIDDIGSEYDIEPTYYAIFSQDLAGNENTKATYSVKNEAWANDLPTHRIYSTIGAQGTSVAFEKKIVTEKGNTSGKDTLWESDLPYPVDHAGKKITYRLQFGNNGGRLSLMGDEFYDLLPEPYNFTWAKEDVEISYRVSDTGITVRRGDADLLSAPDGSEFSIRDNKIIWNHDFVIQFPAVDSKAYIYVTLKFPEGQEWLDYVEGKKNAILHNTLYLHDMPSQVSHTLPSIGTAMLRKGVYETGYYVVDANGTTNKQYFRGVNRFNYIKTPTGAKTVKNTVTYFVVLYNGGDSNLYLSSIYDQLPAGFRFHTLVSTTQRKEKDGNIPSSGCINLYQGTPNTVGLTYNVYDRFAIPSADHTLLEWKWEPNWSTQPIVVNTVKMSGFETVDNTQILKFDITINDEHKDDRGYFLKPKEAIQFGYMCYTGDAEQPKAVNNCAMEYLDYSLAGIYQPKNTDLKVSTYNGIYNDNNGAAEIWDNAKAAAHGFTTVNEKNLAGILKGDSSRQWLASSVELTEGGIKPGITKNVDKYYVKKDSPAVWKIKSENSGTNAMTGYTIDDVMQSPLVFTGEVTYHIYSNKVNTEHYSKDQSCAYVAGSGTKENDYLINILSVDDNGVTVISNKNHNHISLPYGTEQEITVSVKRENNTATDTVIRVCFTKNEKNTSMRIRFQDPAWSIPSDGYSVLTLQTKIPDNFENPDGIYENRAALTPVQEWNQNDVTNGKISEDGKSLTNTATVSIYSQSATASYNEIQAEGKYGVSGNYQGGSNSDFITIGDKTSTITYTMNVSSVDSDMAELVLIDNLPQVGDKSPINDEIARGSEFRVNFAADPNVKVQFVTENGPEGPTVITLVEGTDYFVEYSDKTGGFDNNTDWVGTGTVWHSGLASGDRSIRVRIKKALPKGTIAQVSFDAVIDNEATDSNKAEAGEYAWNSFAYNFRERIDGSGESSMWLHAAPLNAGLEIPSVPSIEKKLVMYYDHQIPAEAENDCTFRFIIYEGEEISFPSYDQAAIESTLQSNNRKFFSAAAPVGKGASASGSIVLKPTDENAWSWVHNAKYTMVELPDNEKDHYAFGFIEDENNTNRSYTFQYDTTKNQLFTVTNIKQPETYELPATGGTGTDLFPVCALLLMAISICGIWQKRKNYRNHEQNADSSDFRRS